MLFQPTNIIPSSLSGPNAGVVDVSSEMEISWQVNGNSPLMAYQIVIMENTTESTVMVDTGRITLPSPHYGIGVDGEIDRFSTSITSSQMVAGGMMNGYENGYKMLITQWWDAVNSVQQSSASFFVTRNAPTFAVSGVWPQVIHSHEYTFTAYYSQDQSVGIRWFRWQIMSRANDGQIVKDTGAVFGSCEIAAKFDGFINGETYAVRCLAATDDDMEISTQWQTFRVEYAAYAFPGDYKPIIACPYCENASIRIQAADNLYAKGVPTGTYSFTSSPYSISVTQLSSLMLPSIYDSVTWGLTESEYLNIDKGSGIAISGTFTSVNALEEPFLEMKTSNGSYLLARNNTGVYLYDNAELVYAYHKTIANNTAFKIVLTSKYFGIKIGTDDAEILTITSWQKDTINTFTLYGPNKYDYLCAVKKNWDYSETGVLLSTAIVPCIGENGECDQNCAFFMAFNSTITAGYLAISGMNPQAISGYSIYKKTDNGSKLLKLVEFGVSNRYIYDHNVASGHTYEYTLFIETENNGQTATIECAQTSGETAINAWNYHLICCEKDENGNHIVKKQYIFALDISSGSMSNNNSPNVMQNFTKYPVYQQVSANYRSGTLSAYIGKVDNDKYVDSTKLMEELYALSASKYTKFLKTQKGEFFEVEVSSPITMQIGDKYAVQPAKISLPWVEVKGSSEESVIGISDTVTLPYFFISPASMDLYMDYTPAYISGNAFGLVNSDLYMYDPGAYDDHDYFISQSMYLMLAPIGTE